MRTQEFSPLSRARRLAGWSHPGIAAVGLLVATAVPGRAQTSVTYNIQTGNFNAQPQRVPSGGYAGAFNNSTTEVGLYAHGGNGGTNESAFQTFSTTGTTSGSTRALQVGDVFSLTMNTGSNPYGFLGAYFDDNTNYNSYANYNMNERASVTMGSSGDWFINNAGSAVDTGIGANVSITADLSVTSSNSFNMTIVNNSTSNSTTYYDLFMENSPSSTSQIQSFAMALQNDNSSNFYIENGSLQSSNAVTIGGSNLNLTYGGLIADGLSAGSTSTASVNSLNKIGSGAITLTAANSYSGGTTVSAGTLLANNTSGSATGSGNVTVNSGAILGGTGNVSGAVAVSGTISAGTTSAIGTLQTGSQTWNTSGAYSWKLDLSNPGTGYAPGSSRVIGGNADKLVMSGLSVAASAGAFAINVTGLNSSSFAANTDYSWVLAQVNNGSASPTLSLGGLTVNTSSLPSSITSNGSFSLADIPDMGGEELVLDYAVAPEPTSLFLLGAAVMPLLARRRNRQAKSFLIGV